jgi:hypothetical protein
MTPTLVLLAAGMSTRYGRLKQLEPVGPADEALLDFAVRDAYEAGFPRVLLIIREELEDAFRTHVEGRWPADLEVVYHHQRLDDLSGAENTVPVADLVANRKKPWGTAHAVLTAKPHLTGPFVLLNADDFYGKEAFGQAMDFMGAGLTGGTGVAMGPHFGLVTYTLADTLSEHGGVSRGICQVDGGGWLAGVREVLEIQRGAEGLAGKSVSGQQVALTGSEPISTNFWILTPHIFPILEEALTGFLKEARNQPEAQPEFLIPTVVNEVLSGGGPRVAAIPTEGRFLGITHPPDREWVVNGLKEMTLAGQYPSPLWP